MEEKLEYEEWYAEKGDDLWIEYHEIGGNYDQDYEEWLEKKYEEYLEEETLDES